MSDSVGIERGIKQLRQADIILKFTIQKVANSIPKIRKTLRIMKTSHFEVYIELKS